LIDRQLNYGRRIIHCFAEKAAPFAVVCDVGAGKGDDLRSIRRISPEATFFAIDSHSQNVSALSFQGFTVFELNIERDTIPLTDESVDVVIANQILEHTKELFWVFHEMPRILKVGGSLILGIPNLASLHNRLLLLAGRQPSSLRNWSAHVRGFTRPDLQEFLRRCFPRGYTLLDFAGSNFYPFPRSMAIILARLLPSLAWGIFFRFEKQRRYADSFLRYPIRNELETEFFLGSSM